MTTTPRKTGLFSKRSIESVSPSDADEIMEAVIARDTAPPPQMRASVREEDPRARAKKRAEELRTHLGDLDEGTDDFYVNMESIPDGWTYEWKRHTVYGQEDPAYQVQLAREGWTPVPASRHPEMMPVGFKEEIILRKGCVLMECPTEIIMERRVIEARKARNQVLQKEAQIAGTPEGTLTRDHARVKPSIKKGYEPMPIPD